MNFVALRMLTGDGSKYFGLVFARSGGLDAATPGSKEGIDDGMANAHGSGGTS